MQVTLNLTRYQLSILIEHLILSAPEVSDGLTTDDIEILELTKQLQEILDRYNKRGMIDFYAEKGFESIE